MEMGGEEKRLAAKAVFVWANDADEASGADIYRALNFELGL